ncbi:magnesium transporter CorA family protein [Amedibacillus sp. YH-ame6]
MFYNFSQGLQEIAYEDVKENDLVFGICKGTELELFVKQFQFSVNTLQEYLRSSHTIHKMDSYYGYDFGLLHVLRPSEQGFQKIKIAFYVTEHLVLVVCDDEEYEKTLYDAVDKMNAKTYCLEHIVSAVMNCVIAGNLKMLEDIENKLADLDEEIINNITDGFNQKTRFIRNDLLFLTHYYEQLTDVCEELLQDENNFFVNQEIHHLRILADRITRLNGNVHMLKDYMLQIREACQSQMDINMNRIMYIFTVVTTIFLPLTLIVGWYGMNFKFMPELQWQYGYITVIVLSVCIIVACIWFFRKKKLLK